MEKLMMSRPSDFRRLAFSAISMIALGLARPMRLAKWGMLTSWKGRWQPRILAWRRPAAGPPPCGKARLRRQDAVPFGHAIGPGGERGVGVALDPHAADVVALLDLVDRFQALDDLAEHRVLAVQPRRGHVGDEELAAVGVGSGIGHGQHAALVGNAIGGLVLEAVARAAAARTLGAAALDHEVRD